MFTTTQLEAIREKAELKLAFAGSMIPQARDEQQRLFYRQNANRIASFFRNVIIDCNLILDGCDDDNDAAASLEQALDEDVDLSRACEAAVDMDTTNRLADWGKAHLASLTPERAAQLRGEWLA